MSKIGIEEFAPELLQLLQVGFKKQVIVAVNTRSQAISLRYRLNLLKSRIRDSKRKDIEFMLKVQARIDPDPRAAPDHEGVWNVVVSPPDQNLTPYIKAALEGIGEVDITTPDLSSLVPTDSVDTLPEGAGGPPVEVPESEAWPLPNSFIPDDEVKK